MEQKIIENYNAIITGLEKIILSTQNKDLKNHSKALYETYIINLAKREKLELDYYKKKLESIDIEPSRINELLEKIKNKSILYTKVDSKESEAIGKLKEENELLTYIFENVYGNKNHEIGIKHEKLVRQLREEFKNPNELSITTWIKNYMEYTNFYERELDKEKLIEYMKLLFKECDKSGVYYKNIDKYIAENPTQPEKEENSKTTSSENKEQPSNEEKGFKILSIKRPKNKKLNKFLKASALVSIWSTAGFGSALLAYGLYKLYKKNGKINQKVNNLFAKFGFRLNNDMNLVDETGKEIDEQTIEKKKTNSFKKTLMNLGKFKDNGFIKKSYKKNKLASLLLDNKVIKKMENKVVVPDTPIKDEENKLILKGMGNC